MESAFFNISCWFQEQTKLHALASRIWITYHNKTIMVLHMSSLTDKSVQFLVRSGFKANLEGMVEKIIEIVIFNMYIFKIRNRW